MPRPKGSKNKPKTEKRKPGRPKKKRVGRPKKRKNEVKQMTIEEDITKLRHQLDRIQTLSDDAYRIKETIVILKMFGYSSKQIKTFLVDGTIPLK